MKTMVFLSDEVEYEHMSKEWHPTLNDSLTPKNTKSGSGKKIWWKCQIHSDHVWQAQVLARSRQGQGCPFCSGKRVLAGFNDLGTKNPELAAQWHPTKNPNITPQEVTESARAKVWWQCNKDDTHEWEAIIQSRKRGNGCPYCGQRKTKAGFNDLASNEEYAAIVAEWHPDNEKSPSDVTVSSNLKVRWLCAQGHDWEAHISNRTRKNSGCPVCRKATPAKKLNFVSSDPKLLSEWNPENPMDADEVSLGSNRKAKWICSKDPSHEWEAIVSERIRGSGCPVCSNKKTISGVNDFASTPEYASLASQWRADNDVLPTEVGIGYRNPIKWECEEGHQWEANLWSRAITGMGCPECAGRKTWDGIKLMVSDYPDLANQWHPSNRTRPSDVSFRSAKVFVWQCPKNKKHVWASKVSTRSLDGSDCAVCAGRVIIRGVNDLASHPNFKQVVKQWHPDNDFSPEEVSYSSNRKAKWQCLDKPEHTWSTVVSARTHNSAPSGCPRCALALRTSRGEQALHDILDSFNLNIEQSVRGTIGSLELDMYISDRKFGVEFNGLYWHSDAVRDDADYHAKKLAACTKSDIKLYSVWEDDWANKGEVVVRDIVKSLGILDELLDLFPDTPAYWTETVKASQTTARIVSEAEAQEFLSKHHVKDWKTSTRYVGLSDAEGRLRAVAAISETNAGVWTVERYAEAGIVTQGLVTLLDWAAQEFKVQTWLAFTDLSTDWGTQYEDAGFTYAGVEKPRFTYLIKQRRVSPSDLTVDFFKANPELKYEDGLTVEELATLNDVNKIWDYGYNRYEKVVS